MTYKRKFATLIASLIAVVCGTLMPTRTLATCDATTIAGNYGFRLSEFVAPNATKEFVPVGSLTPGAFAGRIVFDGTDSVSGFLAGNSGGVLTCSLSLIQS